jgi:hypothetical protein
MPTPIISGPYKTFRPLLPGHSFVEYEGSVITIPLTVRLNNGTTKTAPIQLHAFMRLEVFPAYLNGLRTREFQFIIRDWELFGYSELLNELFYGDPLGTSRVPPAPDPKKLIVNGIDRLERRRQQVAVMTFTLSRNFFKYDDDQNLSLGPVEGFNPKSERQEPFLSIDNLTSHDVADNYIYWQIEQNKDKGYSVLFHCKPPEGKRPSMLKTAGVDNGKSMISKEDRRHLLARADVVADNVEKAIGANDEFIATLTEEEHAESIVTPSEGNTVISKLVRPLAPVRIRWRLGTDPGKGPKSGRIRIVSPAKSICTAHQGPDLGGPTDSADFPARIMYAASYHIFINRERFVEDQAGVAIADGVHEIPPRDVTVAFDKPHAGEVLGRYLEFGPGHCTGMHEITMLQYLAGKSIAEYWRTQPLV